MSSVSFNNINVSGYYPRGSAWNSDNNKNDSSPSLPEVGKKIVTGVGFILSSLSGIGCVNDDIRKYNPDGTTEEVDPNAPAEYNVTPTLDDNDTGTENVSPQDDAATEDTCNGSPLCTNQDDVLSSYDMGEELGTVNYTEQEFFFNTNNIIAGDRIIAANGTVYSANVALSGNLAEKTVSFWVETVPEAIPVLMGKATSTDTFKDYFYGQKGIIDFTEVKFDLVLTPEEEIEYGVVRLGDALNPYYINDPRNENNRLPAFSQSLQVLEDNTGANLIEPLTPCTQDQVAQDQCGTYELGTTADEVAYKITLPPGTFSGNVGNAKASFNFIVNSSNVYDGLTYAFVCKIKMKIE